MYGESSAVKSRRVGTSKPTRTQRKSKRLTSKRNKTYKSSNHTKTKEERISLVKDLW